MNENEFPNDALTDALRREAMAERPAFSPELHERIMDQLQSKPRADRPPLSLKIAAFAYAAASILIVFGLMLYWSDTRNVASPDEKMELAGGISTTHGDHQYPDPFKAIDTAAPNVELAGIVTAEIWPPTLTVQLPSTEAGISLISQPRPEAPPQANNRASLPDMLFAMLQEPTTGVNGALKDVMPPEIGLVADVIGLKN